jgi:hypothetical protein
MAQIKSTIMIELEHSKSSWMDMIRTSGMRRRVFISAFLGLFTQMSGNTLLSYYQNLLYIMMGYTSTYAKTRINLANACWSFATAIIAAYVVSRFRRRVMFMLSSSSMLIVFTCITISFERLRAAKTGGYTNKSAGIAALFFYFAYSPCYNIGNNALTYSMFYTYTKIYCVYTDHSSLPHRTVSLCSKSPRYWNRTSIRENWWILLAKCQSHRSRRY